MENNQIHVRRAWLTNLKDPHLPHYIAWKLKDNSTMNKTEAQIVSYGILYLNPSSHQWQPSYKKYIRCITAIYNTFLNRHRMQALGVAILVC